MRVTKPGVTNGGSTGSMRAEGGACAAYSQLQQGEEGADEARNRHDLKAAAGGEEQTDRGGNACGSPHAVHEDVGEDTWIRVHVVAPGTHARACGRGYSGYGGRPGCI
jgi:hypothetical protein